MAAVMAYDTAEQKRRRKRARIKSSRMAVLLNVSTGALSQYESGKKPLPHMLDGNDYEVALARAIVERADS